eukprot:1717048-Amphidinium_carterae.1
MLARGTALTSVGCARAACGSQELFSKLPRVAFSSAVGSICLWVWRGALPNFHSDTPRKERLRSRAKTLSH